MTVTYTPVLIALVCGGGLGLLFMTLAMLMGPKNATAAKNIPYDCGNDPVGSPRVRFSIKFYQVAILFLVFDIESAFLYPWAVLFRKLSCTGVLQGTACSAGVTFFGFGEMLVFLAVLIAALAYVWRKKAIGWG